MKIFNKIKSKKGILAILAIVLIVNLLGCSFLLMSGFSFGIAGIASGINSVFLLILSNIITAFTIFAAIKPLNSIINDEATKIAKDEDEKKKLMAENSVLKDKIQNKNNLMANGSMRYCLDKKPIIEIRNNYYDVTKQPVNSILMDKLDLDQDNLPKQSWWKNIFGIDKNVSFEIVSVSTKYLNDVLGIDFSKIRYKIENQTIKLFGVNLEQIYEANLSKDEKIEPIDFCFILKNKKENISIVENCQEVIEAYQKYQLEVGKEEKNKLEKSVIEDMTKNLRNSISTSYSDVVFVDQVDDSFDVLTNAPEQVVVILNDLYTMVQSSQQTSKMLSEALSHSKNQVIK